MGKPALVDQTYNIYQDTPVEAHRVVLVDAAGTIYTATSGGTAGGGDGAILDGVSSAIKATVLDYTNSNPLAVRLTDTSGDNLAVATSALQTTGNTSLSTIAGAVAGTEMQVDVLTMPTTTVQATNLDIRDLTSTDVVTVTGGAGQTADVKITLDSEAVVIGAGSAAIGKIIRSNVLVPADYDYVSLSYTGDNLTGVVFKTGGSGGSTVATLTLAYTGSRLDSVTKT